MAYKADTGFGSGPQSEAGFGNGSNDYSAYEQPVDTTVYSQGYGGGGSNGGGGGGSNANEEAGYQKGWALFNAGNINKSRMNDLYKVSQKSYNDKVNIGEDQISANKSYYKTYTNKQKSNANKRKQSIYSGVAKRLDRSSDNFNTRMGENESYYAGRTKEAINNATKHKKSQYNLAKTYGKTTLDNAKSYRKGAIARDKTYTKGVRSAARQEMKGNTTLAANRQNDIVQGIRENLDEIKRGINANKAMLKTNQAQIMRGVDYQSNVQREQSMFANLRNTMGNSLRGSAASDLLSGMQRIDDMNDVSNINAWKQSDDQAYNNWWQANEALTSEYNKQLTSSKDTLSNFNYQYLNNLNENNAKYLKSMLDHNYDVGETIANFDYTTKGKFDTFNYEYGKNARDFDYSMTDQLSKNYFDFMDNMSTANYTYREGLSDLAYNLDDKLSSFDYNINDALNKNDYDFKVLLQNLKTELEDTKSTLRNQYEDKRSDAWNEYWSSVANIVPELAAPWNMKKAAKGEEVSASGDEGEFTLPNVGKPNSLVEPSKKTKSSSKKGSSLNTQSKNNTLSTQALDGGLSTQGLKKSSIKANKASAKEKAPNIDWVKGESAKTSTAKGKVSKTTPTKPTKKGVNDKIDKSLSGYKPSKNISSKSMRSFSTPQYNDLNINYDVNEYTPNAVKPLFSKPITKMGLDKKLSPKFIKRLNNRMGTASTINKRTNRFIR